MRHLTALFIYRDNVRKRTAALAILLFAFSYSLMAQKPDSDEAGKITGRVVDSLSGQPIDYATISLLTQDKDKAVNGTTTDSKGVFKLTNIGNGVYKVQIYFIGYQTT